MFISTDITSPLSANMYAYCENSPVNASDPSGEKGVSDWFNNLVSDFRDYLYEKKQEEHTGTASIGLNASAGFGVTVGISAGIGWDNNGNIGIVATYSSGAGLPTASLTGFASYTNASSLKALSGSAYTLGVSGGETVTFGGELYAFPDARKNSMSTGASVQLGVGIGIPVEYHAEYSYGVVLSFNIYDLLISGCDLVLQEKTRK